MMQEKNMMDRKMTLQQLIRSLELRLLWYQAAVDIRSEKAEPKARFNFPDGDICTWEGAIRELGNTLDMLKHVNNEVIVATPLGTLVAKPKQETAFPGICIALGLGDDAPTIATAEADIVGKRIQTVSYSLDSDEPQEVTTACVREKIDREVNCKKCGHSLVWEHPDCPGLFLASSDYMGCDLCYDCLSEHCSKTDCRTCEIGNARNCRFAYLKEE